MAPRTTTRFGSIVHVSTSTLIVGTAIVLVGVIVAYPWIGQYKGSHPTQTLAECKQLALALNIYITDSDDHFPPDTSSGRGLYRYIKDFTHDASVLDTKNGVSREWLGNGSLAYRPDSLIAEPARTLVLFDSAPRADRNREDGKGRHAMFVDTSSRSISEKAFQAAVANGWTMGAK